MKYFPLCIYLLFAYMANGQNHLGESIKVQLVEDWELAKSLTNEYLTIMPADKYSFRAHERVRSFAHQMLHLAQVNSAMVSHGTGMPSIFPKGTNLEQNTGAQIKDSVIYYVNLSYDNIIQTIKNMDISTFEEKVKIRSMEETRLSWLWKAYVHQTHHRGQTAIYIRLAGVKPPKWME